jgi:glutamate-5-semialdehyde dehydrogenase
MDIREQMRDIAAAARRGGRALAKARGEDKNRALWILADLLESGDERSSVFAANARDIRAAEERGMDAPKVDRLRLTDAVMDSMATACREVAAMSDPVGEIESMWKRPNDLMVGKMRIPLGVVAIIYESRPNVTIDAAVLCLKAGNGVILRGGSEAIHSNRALGGLLSRALDQAGIPGDAVQIVPTTDRAAVQAMLKLDEYIDVVIPRGGEGLIRAVVNEATMPVLKHYKGVCHIFVDRSADLENSVEVLFNAKVQRPSACNAAETVLVHHEVAETFLPALGTRLGAAGVRFKACPRSLELLGNTAEAASREDWGREFLALTLAVRVVDSIDEAFEHIARYGSNHSEGIMTADHARAMRFVREADASAVFINSSTRFNDGGELGLGAEIGISTSKLHAYGPMGIKELTSLKFVVFGNGQIRK